MIEYDYVRTKRGDVTAIPSWGQTVIRSLMLTVTRLQVAVYKLTKGRLWNTIGVFPICIVTMTGAKSGILRQIALLHLPMGDNKLMVASQGGLDKMPVWYHNVTAHPEVKIMVDGTEKNYITRRLSEEDKAALWPYLCSLYPDFDKYQARTDRNIPVFECTPH